MPRPGHRTQWILEFESWPLAEDSLRHGALLCLHRLQNVSDRSLHPTASAAPLQLLMKKDGMLVDFLPRLSSKGKPLSRDFLNSDRFSWKNVLWFQIYSWKRRFSFHCAKGEKSWASCGATATCSLLICFVMAQCILSDQFIQIEYYLK